MVCLSFFQSAHNTDDSYNALGGVYQPESSLFWPYPASRSLPRIVSGSRSSAFSTYRVSLHNFLSKYKSLGPCFGHRYIVDRPFGVRFSWTSTTDTVLQHAALYPTKYIEYGYFLRSNLGAPRLVSLTSWSE